MRIKKGGKKFVQAKIGKIQIWKHPTLFQYFCHNFLHRCSIDLILMATERRLEDLQLCSLPKIPYKSF